MKRLHDWQLRFEAFARERQSQPFCWGRNDCCLFAADAVLAITGRDLAKRQRGTYSTASQALRRLRARKGVAGIATRLLGAPVPPLMARVGDLVLIEMDGMPALGVCNGTSLIGPGPDGIVAFGMGHAKAAWRVG